MPRGYVESTISTRVTRTNRARGPELILQLAPKVLLPDGEKSKMSWFGLGDPYSIDLENFFTSKGVAADGFHQLDGPGGEVLSLIFGPTA
jgi:hypothetical protein